MTKMLNADDSLIKHKLISVIVPVYKVEKYLNKCVQSILNQTYHNLEVIIVDDGSPDKCPEICDDLASKDNRIKVIHKKNGGLSSARNAGIEIATGDYIAFVDSDDYIHEKMYEDMLQLIQKHDADMCICNHEYIDEEGNLYPISFSSPIKNEVLTADQLFQKLLEPAEWYYITAWNKLYKKEILDKNVFPVGKIHEDAFSIHHIIGKCSKIVSTSKKYYYYVQRNGSIMSQRNIRSNLDSTEAMIDRFKYYSTIKRKDGFHFIGVAYSCLFRSMLKDDKIDKSLSQRRTKYFKQVFRIMIRKKDIRAFKLLLVFIYSKIPCRKVVKAFLKKVIAAKRRIKSLIKHIKTFIRLSTFQNKIVLFQAPLHGNIGDQAITIAEYQLLAEKLLDVKIVEVPGGEISSRFWNCFTLKACIKTSDLVLINGGGFLGTLWMNEERQIQKLLSNLYDRKIIILPQTIYYDKDENGSRELKKDKKIYKKCNDLTVFLREKVSDDFFAQNFNGVKHQLVPDMVLWLNEYKIQQSERKGILLCLRHDSEKTQDSESYIKQELDFLSEEYCLTDTVVNHSISKDKREFEVKKKIEEFSKASLIVTDRLHGMVLAAIAETPCIVILSKSHKVKGVYDWIKELDYVELVEDISQIKNATQKVLSVDKPHYDNTLIKEKFVPVIKEIQKWRDTK